jgi:hypothetical protein
MEYSEDFIITQPGLFSQEFALVFHASCVDQWKKASGIHNAMSVKYRQEAVTHRTRVNRFGGKIEEYKEKARISTDFREEILRCELNRVKSIRMAEMMDFMADLTKAKSEAEGSVWTYLQVGMFDTAKSSFDRTFPLISQQMLKVLLENRSRMPSSELRMDMEGEASNSARNVSPVSMIEEQRLPTLPPPSPSSSSLP